jgi:hypothetical protein
MGSVANTDVTIPDAVVPKRELSIDDYLSDTPSTPDGNDTVEGSSEQPNPEPTPAPKRKGGRKPVSIECNTGKSNLLT